MDPPIEISPPPSNPISDKGPPIKHAAAVAPTPPPFLKNPAPLLRILLQVYCIEPEMSRTTNKSIFYGSWRI